MPSFWSEILAIPLGLAAVVLFAQARQRSASRGRHWVLTRLAGAAFCALSLVTPRAVLLLPVFYLISLVTPCAHDSAPAGTRRLRIPDVAVPLTVWALVVMVGHIFAPDSLRADLGALLYPLLGPRWSSNGLWLLAALLVLAIWRPVAGPSFLDRLAGREGAGLAVSRRASMVTAGWLLLLATIYRWLLPGQASLARYLVWMALPYLLWALSTLVVATSDRRRLLWLLPAVAIIWTGRFLTLDQPTTTVEGGPSVDLIPYQNALGGHDLLLVLADGADAERCRLPLERAGVNRIWVFGDQAHLQTRLDDAALLRTFPAVWALLPPDHDLSGLVPEPPPGDLPVAALPADRACFLYRFRPEQLPRPLTVFAEQGRRGLYDHVEGLYDDQVWTTDRFTLDFTVPHARATRLDISLQGWRPAAAAPLGTGLVVQLNGRPLQIQVDQQTYLSFVVPPGLLRVGANRLVATVPTFVPREITPDGGDDRTLGLDLATIILR